MARAVKNKKSHRSSPTERLAPLLTPFGSHLPSDDTRQRKPGQKVGNLIFFFLSLILLLSQPGLTLHLCRAERRCSRQRGWKLQMHRACRACAHAALAGRCRASKRHVGLAAAAAANLALPWSTHSFLAFRLGSQSTALRSIGRFGCSVTFFFSFILTAAQGRLDAARFGGCSAVDSLPLSHTHTDSLSPTALIRVLTGPVAAAAAASAALAFRLFGRPSPSRRLTPPSSDLS